MSNVIQFPKKKRRKEDKQNIKSKSRKKTAGILTMSILCLVLSLSLVNKKLEKGFNAPTQGMRGIASVGDSQFDLDNKKLIKLINSKNSRKVASFGEPGSDADELMFGKFSENFQITRGLSSNLVTSVERLPDDLNAKTVAFSSDFIEKYKRAFGAEKVKAKELNKKIDNNQRLSIYTLYDKKNKVFAQAKVVTDAANDLVSIKIK